MNPDYAAQILMQFNMRKECSRLAKDIAWNYKELEGGIAIPQEPDLYYAEFQTGRFPDGSVSALRAASYALQKGEIDQSYIDKATFINSFRGVVMPIPDAAKLATKITHIWGDKAGLKLGRECRVQMPAANMNIHVDRIDLTNVQITGFSVLAHA